MQNIVSAINHEMNDVLVGSSRHIQKAIFIVRGERIMLDRHLSALYDVSTKQLNQAVKRNLARFPKDFMFQLTLKEAKSLLLRSQFVTLKQGQHLKYKPYASTEHGILMLSRVLKSNRAVAVNIEIMRGESRLPRRLSADY